MHPHDLTGKAQSDSAALRLGREERNEYLLLACRADRRPVIAHIDDDVVPLVNLGRDFDVPRPGLSGVLDKVDENL